jgi:hypothetical protein
VLRKLFIVGDLAQGGRLGLKKSEQKRAKMEPVISPADNEHAYAEQEKMKDGRQGDDDLDDHAEEEDENQMNQI